MFNLSTIAMVLGAGLFVLPVPGTFILGGVLMLAGIAAYLLGN